MLVFDRMDGNALRFFGQFLTSPCVGVEESRLFPIAGYARGRVTRLGDVYTAHAFFFIPRSTPPCLLASFLHTVLWSYNIP